MLLNADKTIIFGRKEALPQLSLQPIHHQEKIVGFLGSCPAKRPTKSVKSGLWSGNQNPLYGLRC